MQLNVIVGSGVWRDHYVQWQVEVPGSQSRPTQRPDLNLSPILEETWDITAKLQTVSKCRLRTALRLGIGTWCWWGARLAGPRLVHTGTRIVPSPGHSPRLVDPLMHVIKTYANSNCAEHHSLPAATSLSTKPCLPCRCGTTQPQAHDRVSNH